MRAIGILLLVMVLLPVAYGQFRYHHRPGNAGEKPVCVTNLRTSVDCASNPGPQQPMVLVRGQLLVLPSTQPE